MIASRMSQEIAFASGVLVFTLVCLWLLVSAIWPRRRGDTLTCRRCRMDLGLSAPGACPGCGASLTRKRHIVRGVRTRRPWLIVFSAVVFALSSTILAIGAVNFVNRRVLYEVAPQWLLIAWVQAPDHDLNIDGELTKRLLRNKLDREGIGPYVDQLIARQPRAITAWVELNVLYDRGWITDQQLQRIYAIAVPVDFETRSVATAGGVFPLRLRLGWTGPQRLVPEVALAPVQLVGAGVEREVTDAARLGLDEFGTLHERCTIDQPGEYTLRWPVTVHIRRHTINGGLEDVYSREEMLEQRVTVVPEEIPRRVREAASNPADAIAVELTGPRLDSGYEARLTARVTRAPGKTLAVPLIGRLTLDAPGRETADLGLLVLRPDGDSEKSLSAVLPGPLPDVFRVTLIPDPEVAPFVLDLNEYWAEPIVFDAIPVRREQAFVNRK